MRSKYIPILVVLGALFCSVGAIAAESDFEVYAEADKDKIFLGDVVKVDVFTKKVPGFSVIFPEKPQDTGKFDFVSSSVIERGIGSSREIGRAYVMSIYTTGPHVIPPVAVKFKDKETGVVGEVSSPQVPIVVRSVLTGDDKDIKDIKALLALKSTVRWIFWTVIVPILILGAVWILVRRIRRVIEESHVVVKTPHEKAYEGLRELKAKDLPAHGQVKEYYSALSDIVRHFLEDRFEYRAPEMTTEEFMDYVKRSPDMEREHKELLKGFLSQCDMVKFAKYGPSPIEVIDSFTSAKNFVDQTKELEEKGDSE